MGAGSAATKHEPVLPEGGLPRASGSVIDSEKGSGAVKRGRPRIDANKARVRLLMALTTADGLAEELSARPLTPRAERLLDQLWLRSVLIEQWRRTRINERPRFELRADRILAALDPS
jgi:hypothetical protein